LFPHDLERPVPARLLDRPHHRPAGRQEAAHGIVVRRRVRARRPPGAALAGRVDAGRRRGSDLRRFPAQGRARGDPVARRTGRRTMKTLAILALALAIATVIRADSVEEIQKMAARLKPVDLVADVSHLSPGDRQAASKLIEASRIVDTLQLRQRWAKNERVHALLQKDTSPIGKARLDYFWMNKGPWSVLDDNKAFLTSVGGSPGPPEKLPGAGFYPEDATKEQLDAWMKSLSAENREQAQWFFT